MERVLSFPGLGLEFELNPIAFSLFGWRVHWYGVIIACGFLLAVFFCCRWAYRFGVDREKLMDMLFFAVPACIVGARAYYVMFNPDISLNADGSFSLYRAIAIWDGGLAIYGAVIVAVITVAIYCRVRRQNFWNYVDVGAYGLLIGQMIGRWGNFVNIEAFGGLTDLPWRMCSTSIANYLLGQGLVDAGQYQQVLDGTLGVHPTFFYESVWNLLGLVLLILLTAKIGRRFNGQIFLSYVIWYGVGRTAIEGLRTDSLYFFGTALRTSQLVGILSAAAALALMIVRFKTAGAPTPPLPRPGKETAEAGRTGEAAQASGEKPAAPVEPRQSGDSREKESGEEDAHDSPV